MKNRKSEFEIHLLELNAGYKLYALREVFGISRRVSILGTIARESSFISKSSNHFTYCSELIADYRMFM